GWAGGGAPGSLSACQPVLPTVGPAPRITCLGMKRATLLKKLTTLGIDRLDSYQPGSRRTTRGSLRSWHFPQPVSTRPVHNSLVVPPFRRIAPGLTRPARPVPSSCAGKRRNKTEITVHAHPRKRSPRHSERTSDDCDSS